LAADGVLVAFFRGADFLGAVFAFLAADFLAVDFAETVFLALLGLADGFFAGISNSGLL
jgi:hypothetical protein